MFCAGVIGASARAFLESPFEYAKVKRQTHQAWKLGEIYQGFMPQYIRSTVMMTYWFCMVDTVRRHTNFWDYKVGQFFVAGTSSLTGFWIIWPFEVIKNLAQSGNTQGGNTTIQRARWIKETQGFYGFYRGILPGSVSVFLRNGGSMVAMQFVNRKITEWGWRD